MSTIETGVIMRIGTNGTIAYPGRDLRNVHEARRIESIGYSIESGGLHRTTPEGERWEHYQYRFHYRHVGRTMSVTWRCGTGYGDPKPIDGLLSAILDAEAVEWEAFGEGWIADLGFGYDTEDREARRKAKRIYDACERVNAQLDRFLGSEREAWRLATEEHR